MLPVDDQPSDKEMDEYELKQRIESATEECPFGPTPKYAEHEPFEEEITITSSIIRAFLFKGEYQKENGDLFYCPAQVKGMSIDKEYKRDPSDYMMRGSYLETLCYGSGAGGHKTMDLPRKEIRKEAHRNANLVAQKKGKPLPYPPEKKIAQIRLEGQAIVHGRQVRRHEMLLFKDGPNKNVQVKFRKRFDMYHELYPNVWIEGEMDHLTPVTNLEGRTYDMCVLDMKVTGDINGTFPPYCWGTPEEMDHIQGYTYHWATDLPFGYMVYDYKPEPGHKVIWLGDIKELGAVSNAIFRESVRKTCSRIRHHTIHGWEAIPEYNRCKNCPLNYKVGGPCKEARRSITV